MDYRMPEDAKSLRESKAMAETLERLPPDHPFLTDREVRIARMIRRARRRRPLFENPEVDVS
jgi:hypothetical protein